MSVPTSRLDRIAGEAFGKRTLPPFFLYFLDQKIGFNILILRSSSPVADNPDNAWNVNFNNGNVNNNDINNNNDVRCVR